MSITQPNGTVLDLATTVPSTYDANDPSNSPMEVSIPALEEGDYSVAVTATDSDGNDTSSLPVAFTYDNTAPGEETGTDNGGPDTINKPEITIPDADDGVVDETELADGVDVEVTLPESTQPGDTITVTVTDPNGDETEIEGTVPTDWDGSSPVTVTIPPETMDEDGTHTVDVTVTDAAGNESTPSDTISFEVDAITDLTAPTLAVAEAADGLVDVYENADGVQVQVTPPAEASAGDEITVTLTQPDGNSISISNTIPSNGTALMLWK